MTGIAQFAARWNQPWKVWSHTPRLNGSVFSLASSQDGTYIAPGHKSWVKQVLEIFAFTEITHFLPNTSPRPCVFVDVRILRCHPSRKSGVFPLSTLQPPLRLAFR